MKRLAILVLVTGCALAAQFGQPLTLHRGESARFSDGLGLTFRRVVSDSRCPTNVVCIQKGDVVVELAASSGGGNAQVVTLDFDHTPTVSVFGHTVELREVKPAPTAPQPATVDYAVTIVVK